MVSVWLSPQVPTKQAYIDQRLSRCDKNNRQQQLDLGPAPLILVDLGENQDWKVSALENKSLAESAQCCAALKSSASLSRKLSKGLPKARVTGKKASSRILRKVRLSAALCPSPCLEFLSQNVPSGSGRRLFYPTRVPTNRARVRSVPSHAKVIMHSKAWERKITKARDAETGRATVANLRSEVWKKKWLTDLLTDWLTDGGRGPLRWRNERAVS